MRFAHAVLVTLSTVGLAACGGGSSSTDAGARDGAIPLGTNKLDILFVVDNTAGAESFPSAMAAALPRLIDPLAARAGGADLHLGIVTPNLGAPPYTIPSCTQADSDEGILQNAPKGPTCGSAGLTNAGDLFLTYVADGAGGVTANFNGTLADAFACYAAWPVPGCGFDQPLGAARAALAAQAANAGFLRADAALAVIIVTNEDDCSMPVDSLLGDPSQQTLDSPLGPLTDYRCFEFGVVCDGQDPGRTAGPRSNCEPGNKDPDPQHQLVPVADLANALRGLKPEPRWVYAAVIAPPQQPVSIRPDAMDFPSLEPPCSSSISGPTRPAPRLARFVAAFDADRGKAFDICQESLATPLGAIGTDLAALLAQ